MMDTPIPPTITSFVIRFVVTTETSQPTYRGSIRHIQTREEINFNSWEEAVLFIRRFVPLETPSGRTTS